MYLAQTTYTIGLKAHRRCAGTFTIGNSCRSVHACMAELGVITFTGRAAQYKAVGALGTLIAEFLTFNIALTHLIHNRGPVSTLCADSRFRAPLTSFYLFPTLHKHLLTLTILHSSIASRARTPTLNHNKVSFTLTLPIHPCCLLLAPIACVSIKCT
jgi:hypothetical protein